MSTSKPLVVVGDSMLDVDILGSATRLSPEAPVPVVDAERHVQRPGGAGLAALLAARTEAPVVLITGIADDDAGRALHDLLSCSGVRVLALPVSGTTVCKIRIRARGQSVLRLDRGDATPVDGPLPAAAADALADARAICVADYGAGVTALPAVRAALTESARHVPVVWDPHPRGAPPVPGCALVTPNHEEARGFCHDDRSGDGGEALLRTWAADAVCITRGAQGARVYEPRAGVHRVAIPQRAAPAAGDVCGAGDRFAVAAAVALAAGNDAVAAVRAAVGDAARFVAAGGAAAVSIPVSDTGSDPLTSRSRPADASAVDALGLAARLRRQGRTVVATGGCFDLLHTGHIRLLRQARELGDALIVLVNSDASVRALKGSGRPVMRDADRARVLAALACVDAVAVFDGLTPERMLEDLRPDIWVKGGDYVAAELPEADVVYRHGGEVVILPTVAGYSSSRLIAAAATRRPE
ncbi:bifunctional heptose 7-phosphate kinase/heptose 1-phosphate adenyltransferase [Mycobacterium avium subsp. hominissuis]|uniref:D-beta-D-heptose 1-phosphate adenosyltransferase n=1 Tax=Mycobacterium avium TaxID=1764 RepID=A0A2A2ZEM5_MYCAV|nr:PfkB family carbohydrate kinase [Mycobacterium avium]ATO63988.2 bifunctional heptose 7-phosphate kinase/heptose 1-phosphate adenyltransferase [Mycobacterium avium subsp. hominissuis]ATO68542.1 adenylyltransferase/cytidyltransferase family protein [Mycobacterium avium subsp. hominissuis]ATO73082.1 adenylyltransferase/cytidyltransferase family protein [Mycobacterium avium subsp. hominissuis]ETZ44562.1 cytidyltransferase-like domain protein [Mycobacterium avium MAV_120709_2344]ETZ47539.1 cytid